MLNKSNYTLNFLLSIAQASVFGVSNIKAKDLPQTELNNKIQSQNNEKNVTNKKDIVFDNLGNAKIKDKTADELLKSDKNYKTIKLPLGINATNCGEVSVNEKCLYNKTSNVSGKQATDKIVNVFGCKPKKQ